jgi:hypothetical protein
MSLFEDADRHFEDAVDYLDDPNLAALFHALRAYAAYLDGRVDGALLWDQAEKVEPTGELWQQAAARGVRALILGAVLNDGVHFGTTDA